MVLSLQIEVIDLGNGQLMGDAPWLGPGEAIVADSWEKLYWALVKKKVENEKR